MRIPDAAIKAAAEALGPAIPGAAAEAIATDAIEAAMPAIREAIAQEIEAYADRGEPMTDHQRGWKAGAADAAHIVRGGTP